VLTLFRKAWHRLRRTMGISADQIERAMQLFGAAHADAVFIQVGANDGMARDPLRLQIERRQWNGVMVEPVPYVFKRLAARYGSHPRIRLEQAAIADREGSLPFYHLREAAPGEKVWGWYHALGSFRREVVLKHDNFIPDIADRLVETQVPCTTMDSLCRRHGLGGVDLLFIDTEGYDYEILRTVNFSTLRPRVLVYEHIHLSPADRQAARDLLTQQGYWHFEHGLDTAALDATRIDDADQALASLFRKNMNLKPT